MVILLNNCNIGSAVSLWEYDKQEEAIDKYYL